MGRIDTFLFGEVFSIIENNVLRWTRSHTQTSWTLPRVAFSLNRQPYNFPIHFSLAIRLRIRAFVEQKITGRWLLVEHSERLDVQAVDYH